MSSLTEPCPISFAKLHSFYTGEVHYSVFRSAHDGNMPVSSTTHDVTIWNMMEVDEALTSALTLRELLRWLHDPKRHVTERRRKKPKLYCCAQSAHNENFRPVADLDENRNIDLDRNWEKSINTNNNFSTKMGQTGKRHKDCVHFEQFKICNICYTCQTEIRNQNQSSDESYQSLKEVCALVKKMTLMTRGIYFGVEIKPHNI